MTLREIAAQLERIEESEPGERVRLIERLRLDIERHILLTSGKL